MVTVGTWPIACRWANSLGIESQMKGKATSIDIAHLAGVSQATVSRALAGSPLVNEETRRRIQAAAGQLNYKLGKNASNLRRMHTGTLALPFFDDPPPTNRPSTRSSCRCSAQSPASAPCEATTC